MLEEIELLEGLQSIDSKNEVIRSRHTEASHEILNLDVVEDHSSDVVGVLLSHGFVWSGLDGGEEVGGVIGDGGGNLGAEGSGVIVSGRLRVRDTEGEIL